MVQRLSALDQRALVILWPIADVAGEVVLLDHLAHVLADLVCGGDRRPDPGLEAVAEGVEVAVGADARDSVCVSQVPPKSSSASSTTNVRPRALLRQVIGGADAGDAGPDDQHVEVLGGGQLPWIAVMRRTPSARRRHSRLTRPSGFDPNQLIADNVSTRSRARTRRGQRPVMARLVRATHEHLASPAFMGPPHSAALQRGMTRNVRIAPPTPSLPRPRSGARRRRRLRPDRCGGPPRRCGRPGTPGCGRRGGWWRAGGR